jgi:predicted amidophosphoribosyltransferase
LGQGYVLDAHIIESTYIGDNEYGHPVFDTKRSAVGELLFQLKYRNDPGALAQIVETVSSFLKDSRLDVNLIVPMPPSNSYRRIQPVIEIARGVSAKLGLALSEKGLIKVKSTPQLKNVYDLKERERILADAFAATKGEIFNKKILLLDDLYRSGATMNAAARELRAAGALSVNVLAATHTRNPR